MMTTTETSSDSTTQPTAPAAAQQRTMCPGCRGRGYVVIPNLENLSMAEIARGTGRSRSLFSRMFSDDPKQKRPNPTLETMRAVCKLIEQRTGQPFSLDQLAQAIDA